MSFASAAEARDWFVHAGSSGDGTMQKPFGDPWQALEACEAGDVIHIAEGKYYGRSGIGMWKIPFDNITIMGGYDAQFKQRDPWKYHTELTWDDKSKNKHMEARILSNSKGAVVDGVVIDMQTRNEYQDEQRSGLRDVYVMMTAIDMGQYPSTVRNSVIINAANNAIQVAVGSTVENNLIVNALGWGIQVKTSAHTKEPAQVKNNTVIFSATFKEPGKGAYQGSALAIQAPANVTGNILAFSDNNGIYMTADAEKVSVTKNIFFMNLYSNLKFTHDGNWMALDDKSMDQLDEVGFKGHEGNETKNPGLTVDHDWMDRYSKRTAYLPGKLEMDDWNKVRQLAGLPMIAKGGKPATGVAPPWSLAPALKLMEPKSAGKIGARELKLDVKLQGGGAAPVAKNYQKVELESWNRAPDAMNQKAIEMIVGIGDTANVSGIPAPYKPEEHAGMFLYDKAGHGERVLGFWKKGSAAQRAAESAAGWYHGSGVPDRLFVARGTAYAVGGVTKGAMYVDSLEAYDGSGATAAAQPKGRDWFVRHGATGGNGSKEKPFKDPFQALEKCESGDMIHVSEGEYNGKLKAGHWKVDTSYISLLGGYNKDFTKRNPWKHPTFLKTAHDFKGHRQGYTIDAGAEGDTTGLVIDGFIFDKAGDNKYKHDGDLDYDNSDKEFHIWAPKPGSAIRNNVFVNGAEGALRVNNGVTIENNIIVNHHLKAVDVQAPGFGNAPAVIRHNTFAFAWDVKFGMGRGRSGSLLQVGTRLPAVIDNNIFEFADNDAIRLAADAKDVELTNNVFSHNLNSNVYQMKDTIFVDDKAWKQLGDLGFKKLEGNAILTCGLPVDKKWFDIYLSRTAMTPGKVSMDDWNQARELLGQPLIATGGKPGNGFMPKMDWKDAIDLWPKNPKCKAGAREKDLPVKFEGVAREEVEHEYTEVDWETARNASAWEKLDGKRVAIKLAIKSTDNQYQLPDVKQETYQCFMAGGPEGTDSGPPMRAYVKKGTKYERVMSKAKGYGPGKPEEFHMVKGIARANRQLVAEVIEKAD